MSQRLRTAHKTDTNQQSIMDALRDAGCLVADTSMVGNGFPDLTVGFFDGLVPHIVLFEVKSKGGKLTESEEKFNKKWKAFFNHVYFVVYNAEEALKKVGKL